MAVSGYSSPSVKSRSCLGKPVGDSESGPGREVYLNDVVLGFDVIAIKRTVLKWMFAIVF